MSALIRVQLEDSILRQLKARAHLRNHALEIYADMIFHYLMRERSTTPGTLSSVSPGNSIYLLVELPHTTKLKLSQLSQKRQMPLAVFTGLLVTRFLHDFEKDPRDFSMIHYVSSLLDRKSVLSEAELRTALNRCDDASDLRLPPGHLAKWYYSRLKPIIGQIEKEGRLVELTIEMLASAR